MKSNVLILLILFNIALTLFILLKTSSSVCSNNFPEFLKPKETLQQAYLDGIIYCRERDFANSGAFTSCMNEYIEQNAQNDIQRYKRIKLFCELIKDNECDIDNCVTGVIVN